MKTNRRLRVFNIVFLLALPVVVSMNLRLADAQKPRQQSVPQTPTDKDSPEIILIPAGEFRMGSTDADVEWVVKTTRVEGWRELVQEETSRTLSLPAFYIAKYEVTNKEYKKFVDETRSRIPALEDLETSYTWSNGTYPPGLENHPVVLVSHEDAKKYAVWLSQRTGKRYRLPTSAEWEKAACWDDTNKAKLRFPWGNEYNSGRGYQPADRGRMLTEVSSMTVGSVEFDKSPYGVYDMGQNVAEWVADREGPNARLKGTGFLQVNHEMAVLNSRCAHSYLYPANDEGKHVWRGFRIARDP